MATNSSIKEQLQTQGQVQPARVDNSLQGMISNEKVIDRFTGILGDKTKASRFLASILALSNEDKNLAKCSATSVINCAMLASTFNLSLQKSLGHSFIVGYNGQAQLQLGFKGLLSLAMNSGTIKKINVVEIYEGQLNSFDPLFEEIDITWENRESDVVVGFIGIMELNNGFRKMIYRTSEEMKKHGEKYAKYNKKMWNDEFVKMAQKTVLKQLLKYAPLSFDIQNVINVDGGTPKTVDPNNIEYMQVEYPDAIEVNNEELEL